MSFSSKRDEAVHIQEKETKRQAKKNSAPERYNDPFKDQLRTQGKGSKNRISSGWYADEITERLKKIYGEEKTD